MRSRFHICICLCLLTNNKNNKEFTEEELKNSNLTHLSYTFRHLNNTKHMDSVEFINNTKNRREKILFEKRRQ